MNDFARDSYPRIDMAAGSAGRNQNPHGLTVSRPCERRPTLAYDSLCFLP